MSTWREMPGKFTLNFNKKRKQYKQNSEILIKIVIVTCRFKLQGPSVMYFKWVILLWTRTETRALLEGQTTLIENKSTVFLRVSTAPTLTLCLEKKERKILINAELSESVLVFSFYLSFFSSRKPCSSLLVQSGKTDMNGWVIDVVNIHVQCSFTVYIVIFAN